MTSVYLIAGEPSGDLLGGRLMHAIKAASEVEFAGIGGETMRAQGLSSLFPMAELSVMGLVEVLAHAPRLLRRISETVENILLLKPDVVVTIDAPDFCFRVARQVRKRDAGIKLVHYVAPSVWAWRPGRAAKIACFLDHLLALLPFEPPYFEKVGLACTFVGHPAVESITPGDANRFRIAHNVPPDHLIVSLLPGSRHGEIRRLLPLFIEVAKQLQQQHGNLFFVVPTLSFLTSEIELHLRNSRLHYAIVQDSDSKADAFAASHLALAASGTVALELSLAGVPAVIAYRVNPLTAFLAHRLVKLDYVSLPNLILNEGVMPEFLQQEATSNNLVTAMRSLIEDGPQRKRQLEAGKAITQILCPEGLTPSTKAARIILQMIPANDGHVAEATISVVPPEISLPPHR